MRRNNGHVIMAPKSGAEFEQLEDVVARLSRHADTANLQAAIRDHNGVQRGKRIPVKQVKKILAGSLRMPLSIIGSWRYALRDANGR